MLNFRPKMDYRWVYCVVVSVHVFLWLLLPSSYPREYLYSLPVFVGLIYLMLSNKVRLSKSLLGLFGFLFISISILFIKESVTESSLKDLFLITLGIFPYMLRIKFKGIHIRFLFLLIVITGFVDSIMRFDGITDFNLLRSVSPFESNISLVIGVFSIALFQSKSQRIIPILFTILFFKRIAVFGSLIIYLLSFFRDKYFALKKFLPVAAFLIGFLFAFNQIVIFESLSGVLIRFNVDINTFTMGRFNISRAFLDEIKAADVSEILFGKGVGSSRYLSLEASNNRLDLPHCDYIRLLYEFGIMGAIIYLLLLIGSLRNTPLGNFVLVYLAVLFLTENILIYPGYHWIFYAVAQSSQE